MQSQKIFVVTAISAFTLSCTSRPTLRSSSDTIDSFFKDYTGLNVPGASVLVIKDGRVLERKSYGMANLEQRLPVTSSTNFRLASLTKQFTAMAVLLLAEDGKISLDDPITKFFPSLPNIDKDTHIRQLLNHTSGIIDYESLIPDSQTVQVLDTDVLRLLEKADSVYFPSGTKFEYSNSGYVLLSLIIESVAHQPFAEFLKQNLFVPLGMSHSVVRCSVDSVVANRAYGYTRTDSGFIFADQSVTSATLGDGGIYSSIDDLFHWDEALYGNGRLSANLSHQAFAPTVKTDTTAFYGFGWFVDTYKGMECLYHTGSSRGFRNAIMRLPGQSFTVIILTNRNEGEPIDIARKITDLYFPHTGP